MLNSRQAIDDALTNDQLRTVLDALYDGNEATTPILINIQYSYKRAHHIFLWLVRNQLRGQKLVDFFRNESGDLDGGGLLSGVTKILNSLDGVTKRRLKANELR